LDSYVEFACPGLVDRAIDVQVAASTAVPADPLGWEGGVTSAQRPEAEMMAAVPEDGVAARELTADAVAGRDLLRVEPFPERDRPLPYAASERLVHAVS
jgi:hypothetical protein